MFRREKRQPDGLHACGTTGEKEKSLSVLFKGPGSQNQSKKKIKKKKKLNKGVESNPGFSTRFHFHHPVDLWLASAKALFLAGMEKKLH